ncbi:triple tyrosine motif-containing protein [Flaviramulus aquimarinus]|uniref:Triple tyrosine motif-containing protein n=2 Tax=Flaviramulus aquimarinus TaxID=1170456 RepID=A0ABP9FF28_9FLAO
MSWSYTFSQKGLPNGINYDKNDYGAGRQNWDIDIDEDGIVYFGNSNGLLYNVFGDWGLKTMTEPGDVRAVFVHNDTIWCGGNEIGYFTKLNGDYKFTSLGKTTGGPVWNIEALEDHIVYQCENQIIYYNTNNQSLHYENYSKIGSIAKWDTVIWMVLNDGILGYLENLRFISIGTFSELKNREVRKMFIYNDLLYFVMLDGELLNFNGTNINNVLLSETLRGKSLFTGNIYSDSSFCLGTVADGFVQIDDNGTILKHINSEVGLLDDTVLSMMTDKEGNIWLGLDYGIAKIDIESPINSIFNSAATYDLIDYKNHTYLATNKGLFVSSKDGFKFVENTGGQVWKLRVINNDLYVCHNNGLFKLENDQLKQVEFFTGFIDIAHFEATDYYLFSTYIGLILVKREGDQFISLRKLNLWYPKLVYDKTNNCIWAEIKDDKIYKLSLKENFEILQQDFPDIKKVFDTDKGVFFSNDKEILKYKNHQFSKVTQSLLDEVEGVIKSLNISTDGRAIAYVQNDKIRHQVLLSDGNVHSFDASLEILSDNLIKNSEFIKIKNDKLFIAEDRGVKTFDYNYKYNFKKNNNPIISTATILNDSNKKYYFPYSKGGIFLNSGNKDINFNFNINKTAFDYVEYRYRLLPKEETWTKWDANAQSALYTQLKGGRYTLQLQSRLNGGETKETFLKFTIEKLWHQTGLIIIPIALIVLVWLFGVVIIMSRINRKKLIKQERVYKQQNMQKTLAMKNEQLLQYTEIISHKNEFLNRIKLGLEKINDPKIKRWVNTISKEVNNEKKEFLFHKLFSEVHQDFISRITKTYPSITSNDVRMLSYIRINLDKIEISNLMNISPRSIDMSRYRIRKKLKLAKGTDLNQFVREF